MSVMYILHDIHRLSLNWSNKTKIALAHMNSHNLIWNDTIKDSKRKGRQQQQQNKSLEALRDYWLKKWFKMTISYQNAVGSSTAGGFTALLFKWKGSIYQLIYRELIIYLSAYITLSLVYRQLLTKHQKM